MKNLSLLVLGLYLPLCLLSSTAYSNSMAELERIASQAKTLEEFLGSTIVKEQYFNALKTYQHRDRFRCESFDKILAKVKTLSEKVPGFSKAVWEKTSATDVEVVAYRPIDDKKGSPFLPDKFMFRGTPRRFHALWNDPSLSGCYSDACNEDDTAMPDRWSVAMNGSELYYVEKNGIFTDQSVLFLPLKRKDKEYRLIVVGGGPALLKEVDIWNGGRHKSFRQNLAQTLAQRLQKSRWKDNRQELLINKTERNLASTAPKAEGPVPVDEFTVADSLGASVEAALPRKCLAGTLKALAAALGKKTASDEALQKFPINSMLNPAFNDINAVSKMLADGSIANKLPEASTLSDGEKELVDTQLMKLFMNPNQDPALRSRAGLALNQFNRPDFSNALANRSNPYRAVAMNPNEVKSDVAAAFARSLHDPSQPVKAAAALGAIDSIRPIPPDAIKNLEGSFRPGTAEKLAKANPDLLNNLVGAADRAGVFSPDLDKNTSRPSPKIDGIEQLAKAINEGQRVKFPRMSEIMEGGDLERAVEKPDSRRRAISVLAQNLNSTTGGGNVRAQIRAIADPDISPAARDSLRAAVVAATKCSVEDSVRKKIKSRESIERGTTPPSSDTAYWEHWLKVFETVAWANAEHDGDGKQASNSEGLSNLWACHEDGSTPSMVQRHVGKSQMYFLNTMWDGKNWKSVAPGTPNSVCRYFLSDENGGFSYGYIAPGSIATGALLNHKDPQDTRRYIYIPPDYAGSDPNFPTGWVKLCTNGPAKDDKVAFVHSLPEKFEFGRDVKSLSDLLKVREGDETLEAFAAKTKKLDKKLEDPNFMLSKSRCSSETGEDSEPLYCTLNEDQKSKVIAMGSDAFKRCPQLIDYVPAKEKEL